MAAVSRTAKKTVAKEVKSAKKAKRTKAKVSEDGFLVLLPLVDRDGLELPVLNKNKFCIAFTKRERLDKWREILNLEISRILRYPGKESLPRLIRAMFKGIRPVGIALDGDPQNLRLSPLKFISKRHDVKLEKDLPRIFDFVMSMDQSLTPVRGDRRPRRQE